jgi:monoamine oxidase
VLENLFCAGTFKKILDVIAKPALQKADLKLSTEVIRIETGSSNVKVVTKDGSELEFDEVVMTAPLGWLKQHKDSFVPPLPARLSEAIGSIGYGSLEKVCLSHYY